MAGADNIIINSFERALSSDINDLQSLKDRNTLEAFKYMLAGDLIVPAGTGFGTQVRSLVLGGLTVDANGADVDISPGVLMQNSNTLAPTPGVLDSSFRYARHDPLSTFVMPVGDNFYLVEAQMQDTTTLTVTRDIFDPVSQTFTPTVVDKRKEREIAFQALTGTATSAPAPTGGDWVPIAIVQKVGGSVTQVIDVRPMLSNLLPTDGTQSVLPQLIATNCAPTGAFDTLYVEDFTARTQRALLSFRSADAASVPPTVLMNSSTFLATGNPFTAVTFQYLYLCEWFGLTPRGAYASALSAGVLCVSEQGPSRFGARLAPAGVQLPAPYDNYTTVGDGDGALVSLQSASTVMFASEAPGQMVGEFGVDLLSSGDDLAIAFNSVQSPFAWPDCIRGVGVWVRRQGAQTADDVQLQSSGGESVQLVGRFESVDAGDQIEIYGEALMISLTEDAAPPYTVQWSGAYDMQFDIQKVFF